MKQVRIEPMGDGYGIDVTCDCGKNGLTNTETGEANFKHRVELGGNDINLECECGSKIVIRSQLNHFHVAHR